MNILFLIVLLIGLCCGVLQAKVYLSQSQALQTVVPSPRTLERKTLFLTAAQVGQIERLARAKVESPVVTYYLGKNEQGETRIIFFDKRIVRTMPVTYMTVIKPAGEIDRVEILNFDEPEDYLPRPSWIRLYRNRALSDDLVVGRAIPRVTGASLTSQAMNDGIRTQLSIYQVAVKPTLR